VAAVAAPTPIVTISNFQAWRPQQQQQQQQQQQKLGAAIMAASEASR
jgi:preprotein translocase subunit YajC